MFKPLKAKKNRGQVSTATFLPAPTKGWHVGANLADAPPGTAFVLENVFCQLDYIRLRRGCSPFVTGMLSTSVSSLLVWVGFTGSKMFAACGGGIYDVSSAGAVGPAAISGQTNDYWEGVQFSPTGATSRLLICNGADPEQNYDGSSWSTSPAITGMGARASFGWSFKNRIYLIEANTLNAYYLGLAAIGGAATKFEMGGIFKLGGKLICGATWAIDSTSGIYEACVFITSEGEVAMYDGPYPGDPSWTLKGVYKVSRPLGPRCLMKAGGDLAIMTEDGIVPMSKVQQLDQVALQNFAVTQDIAPAWREAVLTRRNLQGWQIAIWPLESMGVICIPQQSSSDKQQFIANVRTGAWSRYTGWDAKCFAVHNNQLYFGTSDGRVMTAETTGADDGRVYSATIFPSFSGLGSNATRKQVKAVRFLTQANFTASPKITVKVDFDTTVPLPPTSSPLSGIGSVWGTAVWGSSLWSVGLSSQANWSYSPGYGSVVSPVYQVSVSSASDPDFRMTAAEVLYENGSILG